MSNMRDFLFSAIDVESLDIKSMNVKVSGKGVFQQMKRTSNLVRGFEQWVQEPIKINNLPINQKPVMEWMKTYWN